jgi:excisionase family DNA binding protein
MTISRTTPVDQLASLVTVSEAAVWLGVGRGVVYEMARRDPAFATRIGRLVRVRRAALAALAGVVEHPDAG